MFQQFFELHGRYGPEGQLQWHVQSWFFPVFLHLALCCPRRTGKLDYLEDGVYFLRPLVSGSHLFVLLPEEYNMLISGR